MDFRVFSQFHFHHRVFLFKMVFGVCRQCWCVLVHQVGYFKKHCEGSGGNRSIGNFCFSTWTLAAARDAGGLKGLNI